MADLPVAGKCMICSKEIRYDHYDDDDKKYYNLNGGSYVRIHAGYGSTLDTLEFKTVVCDECLKDCMHSERIIGIREYMGDLFGNTKKEEDKVFQTPEEHFQEMKVIWKQRDHTEKGRKINRKLLAERSRKPWDPPKK